MLNVLIIILTIVVTMIKVITANAEHKNLFPWAAKIDREKTYYCQHTYPNIRMWSLGLWQVYKLIINCLIITYENKKL